ARVDARRDGSPDGRAERSLLGPPLGREGGKLGARGLHGAGVGENPPDSLRGPTEISGGYRGASPEWVRTGRERDRGEGLARIRRRVPPRDRGLQHVP